jgi:hypothetical protein
MDAIMQYEIDQIGSPMPDQEFIGSAVIDKYAADIKKLVRVNIVPSSQISDEKSKRNDVTQRMYDITYNEFDAAFRALEKFGMQTLVEVPGVITIALKVGTDAAACTGVVGCVPLAWNIVKLALVCLRLGPKSIKAFVNLVAVIFKTYQSSIKIVSKAVQRITKNTGVLAFVGDMVETIERFDLTGYQGVYAMKPRIYILIHAFVDAVKRVLSQKPDLKLIGQIGVALYRFLVALGPLLF